MTTRERSEMIDRFYHSRWFVGLIVGICGFAFIMYIKSIQDSQAKSACESVEQVADTVNPMHTQLKGIADGVLVDAKARLGRAKEAKSRAIESGDGDAAAVAQKAIDQTQPVVTEFQKLSDASKQIGALKCSS
jgi:hypothetical protein